MTHKELIRDITTTLRKPAVFRNLNFSRCELAGMLGVGETLLSDVMNNEMGTTFHQLLNENRCKYARKVMSSGLHDRETLEEIAAFCGFSSRLTMHRYFVGLYGVTPGQFKKTIGK